MQGTGENLAATGKAYLADHLEILAADGQPLGLQAHPGQGRLPEKGLHAGKARGAPCRRQQARAAGVEVVGQGGEHQEAGGVDVEGGVRRQHGDVGQQLAVVQLGHAQHQAQLGDIAHGVVGRPIRRLQQQVLVVFRAIGAEGLLVGVEPVHQALGVGRLDAQAQQQAAELADTLFVDLAIAHQAVEVQAAAGVVDAHAEGAAVIQLEGTQRPCPGFAQVIHRGTRIALAQVA
ncbi:hypothetical protein D3C78_1275540 [compost metagenome]